MQASICASPKVSRLPSLAGDGVANEPDTDEAAISSSAEPASDSTADIRELAGRAGDTILSP